MCPGVACLTSCPCPAVTLWGAWAVSLWQDAIPAPVPPAAGRARGARTLVLTDLVLLLY